MITSQKTQRSIATSAATLTGLQLLNRLAPAQAEQSFRRCCASGTWARRMTALRPFASVEALADAAAFVWFRLSPDDWREAFAAHPRIGGEVSQAAHGGDAGWAAGEQTGATTADETVQRQLAEANADYEAKFGTTFIVCATGMSAAEMLAQIRSRLGNKPETEVRIAAEEEAKITALRLEKMLLELAGERR